MSTAVVDTHREHGTHVKYVIDVCRCEPCREANRAYERERRARIEPAYVAAGPARAHCRELMAAGVGLKQIIKTSGISSGAIWKLLYGKNGRPSKRIRRETEQRILAITPAHIAGGAKIPAGPTWALVDEMVAAGAAKSEIAAAIGQTGPGLQLSRHLVMARSAAAIAELHAAWRAGSITLGRRDSWGNYTIATPPPPPERRPSADVSDLLLELAEIVEERTEQAEWRQTAACRGRPAYLWFPGRGDNETADRGRRICDACMVRDQCRAANFDQRDGTYGGLTAGARRQVKRLDAVAA